MFRTSPHDNGPLCLITEALGSWFPEEAGFEGAGVAEVEGFGVAEGVGVVEGLGVVVGVGVELELQCQKYSPCL